MEEKYSQARNLYFQTELTQAEIAKIIGVATKTLYRWIRQDDWKRIKTAARQAPAAIVERLYTQLMDLNDSICGREPGKRIPTIQEADINRKLIISIAKLKDQASKQDSIQVLTNFTSWLNTKDATLARKTKSRADEYLNGAFKNGHNPYEMEYDYDELEDEPEPEAASTQAEPIELSVSFNGYSSEKVAHDLPPAAGVYCVYEAAPMEEKNWLDSLQPLYIGEAENLMDAVVSKIETCKPHVRPGNIICVSYAKTFPDERKMIAAALIHNVRPILNTEYNEPFPFDPVHLKTSGENARMSRSFLTERVTH